MKKLFSLLSLFIIINILQAQDTLHSKYGKSLPAYGTLRILILYAEIDYDVNPEKNPQANHTYRTWKPGELPQWKHQMADPFPDNKEEHGWLTRYYKESSFGKLTVLGDYLPFVITVKESETNSSNQTHVYNQKVLEKVCAETEFVSANGLQPSDFDLWTLTSYGKPKITPSVDDPIKIDHVMIVYRNIHCLPVNNGFASPASPSPMCGLKSDTYSTFSSGDNIPFNVSKHEVAHLIVGDNNFHPYGPTVNGQSYFTFSQAGWSLLSAANATLLTCNAWDRDRLDWRPPEKKFSISAVDETGKEISTDLTPEEPGQAGIYFLRDFVTTGDAMRIKIPVYNQEMKYSQWLWIENHQTSKNNGSLFDHFQYQSGDCTEEATPGLYMFMQVSKNERSGANIYGGYHNYIRSVLANGNFDWNILPEKEQNACKNDVWYFPYEKIHENPFTGTHHQEFPVFDLNNDGIIEDSEQIVPAIEFVDGKFIKKLAYLGDSGNAFTMNGKKKISIATNPSTAPALNPESKIKRLGSPVNRVILLNGISIEILEEMTNGTIKVQVRFDDTKITNDVRWCADSILLPKIKGTGFDLNVNAGKTILLDHGITPTRFSDPKDFNDRTVFASLTIMVCMPETSVNLEQKAKIIVDNGSTLIIGSENEINLTTSAEIIVRNGGLLKINPSARIFLGRRSRITVDKSSVIHFSENSLVRKGKRAKVKINGKKLILEP